MKIPSLNISIPKRTLVEQADDLTTRGYYVTLLEDINSMATAIYRESEFRNEVTQDMKEAFTILANKVKELHSLHMYDPDDPRLIRWYPILILGL